MKRIVGYETTSGQGADSAIRDCNVRAHTVENLCTGFHTGFFSGEGKKFVGN